MMRHSMIRALLLVAFVGFFSLVGVAQNYGTVSFVYDANGNRISRSLQFRSENRNGLDSDSLFVSSLSEMFDGTTVKIYPNPTPDHFSMLVNGDVAVDAHVFLFTVEGVLLEEKTIRNSSVEFDLSGRSTGVYLVKLMLNGESKAWRVLKK